MDKRKPLLIPIPQACIELGDICRSTVYKLIAEEHLDLVHIGRRSFVTGESLMAYVARLSHKTVETQAAVPVQSRC